MALFQTGNDTSAVVTRVSLSIPNVTWYKAAVVEAMRLLTIEGNWRSQYIITPEQAAQFASKALDTIRFSMDVGTIIASVLASMPANYLLCDGSEYDRADYPELASLLAVEFLTAGDKFIVPDLRGRTVIGAGAGAGLSVRTMNASGGEESHMLDVNEMASHSHSVFQYASGVAGISVDVPVAVATTPFSTVTGSTPALGTQTALNVMQPFTALNYYVIAE